MTAPTRAVSEGNTYAFLSFYNPTTGDPTGPTTTAPANGLGADADTLLGVKVAAPTTPEPEMVQVTAERLLAEFELDPLTTRSYTAQLAGLDMDQVAQIQNTSVTTLGAAKSLPEDADGLPEIDALVIYNARAKSQDVGGNRGKGGWQYSITPMNSVKWLGRDSYTARQAAMYNIRFTPQTVDHAIGLTVQDKWGVPATRRIIGTADYPMCLWEGRGSGALSIIPVRNRPIDVAHCFCVVIPAGYATGGIETAILSVSRTLPYNITLASSPAAGSKIRLFYEADAIVDA